MKINRRILVYIRNFIGRKTGISFSRHKYLRPMFQFINKELDDKNLVGIEVGVFKGENAKSILENMDIQRLYLIDAYKSYEDYSNEFQNHTNLNRISKEAKERLRDFEKKIKFIEKESTEAVKDIKEKVDFVYIDSNHSQEYVKKDLELYFPLVKRGGVFGGHDFGNGEFQGLTKAIMEFCVKNNLKINVCDSDWWTRV